MRFWVNISDVGDLIAIPAGGVASTFQVDEDHSAVIGAFEFHRASAYLQHSQTARAIAECLGVTAIE